MSPQTHADDPDATDLGIRLAQANAIAFVAAHRDLSAEERLAFISAFLACISGLCEQAIGHRATTEAFTHVASLRPVEALRARH